MRLAKFPVIHSISNNKTLPVYPHLTSLHIIELKDHYVRTVQLKKKSLKKIRTVDLVSVPERTILTHSQKLKRSYFRPDKTGTPMMEQEERSLR